MERKIINPIFKDTVTFIKTAAETNGKYSVLKTTLMPGGGNVPHIHTAFTETFIAVKGVLGLQLKNEKKLLKIGERYTVEKKQVHHFFNPGNTEITFEVIFEPGHEGMENMLRIAYGLAADGLTDKKGVPSNVYHTALLMEMGNTYLTGMMSLLKPVFSWLAARAKAKGMDKALIAKYCGSPTRQKVVLF